MALYMSLVSADAYSLVPFGCDGAFSQATRLFKLQNDMGAGGVIHIAAQALKFFSDVLMCGLGHVKVFPGN